MKNTSDYLSCFYFFVLTFCIFFIASCKKKETTVPIPIVVETCSDGIKNQTEVEIDCGGTCSPCAIKYPTTGTHGVNILYGSDTLKIPGTGNSLKAIVPEGSNLKIEFSLVSGPPWMIQLGTNIGWTISNYLNGQQSFIVENSGTTELRIIKAPIGGTGSILVKFFENSTTETRRKIIVWN